MNLLIAKPSRTGNTIIKEDELYFDSPKESVSGDVTILPVVRDDGSSIYGQGFRFEKANISVKYDYYHLFIHDCVFIDSVIHFPQCAFRFEACEFTRTGFDRPDGQRLGMAFQRECFGADNYITFEMSHEQQVQYFTGLWDYRQLSNRYSEKYTEFMHFSTFWAEKYQRAIIDVLVR